MVLLGQSPIQKTSQFKDLCWAILDYFGAHLSAVYTKVHKDVFSITPILTALKQIHSKSSPGGHFRVSFSLSCRIFLYFLRTVWLLMKICTYILDNTLMVLHNANFERGVFLEGGRAHFQYFSHFLEKSFVCFMKFCKDILSITLAIT